MYRNEYCRRPRGARAWCGVLLGVLLPLPLAMPAERAYLAFLARGSPGSELGPEARSAYELARGLAPTALVFWDAQGEWRDGRGTAVSLAAFRVLWLHHGDSAELSPGPVLTRVVESLREQVSRGCGLFLSGAALALVNPLGIEAALPRLFSGGCDGYVAGLVPIEAEHPAFEGLRVLGVRLDESVGGNPREYSIPIVAGGYPATADFFGTDGPRGGKLLARATAGSENPLVEYSLGRGRVIAMGWRLPHYANLKSAHRRNLDRLTSNILAYLGDPRAWRDLIASPAREPPGPETGVREEEWGSLRDALADLIETFGPRYPRGAEFLKRLEELRRGRDAARGPDRRAELEKIGREFEALRSEALLANPLLAFERLLLIKRGAGKLGLPQNWQSNTELDMAGYDNELAALSPVSPRGKLAAVFRPEGGRFLGDVDLHASGERLLFSMPGSNGRWQVFEMRADGTRLRELALICEPDVDNYDACYLPDGGIVFSSTATFAGVPCVFGSSHVTNLYRLGRNGSISQLTVDQDHNWCPAVANDGRVLYLRWEYTDLPHSNSRRLFLMNPDGTGQAECYGSNSFFPNSTFYARPIPCHPTMVVGIASGHHGTARSGRLLLLDPGRGRHEASGVVQEVPRRWKVVEPTIRDNLVDGVWPQFLHPFPLSDKYFLVSAKKGPDSLWGVYLVDAFDNMLLIKEVEGYALLEPVPLQAAPLPPIVPDRVDLARTDALVMMTDVYLGDGLKGIPRGTVKRLRLIAYHYAYRDMGGLLGAIGMDGPWDIKRVLGTVPVEADGSAAFTVPASTPIAVQPLDGRGQAVQIMRSWFTAMPGEVLSCVGCHERQNTTTPNRRTLASSRAPSAIEAWHGPPRGFAFHREVQPVLDRSCAGCHDGEARPDGAIAFDLRGDKVIADWDSAISGHVSQSVGGKFSTSYVELHRFVRRPGIESDIRLLTPMEFHADTTELVQVLRKGHYGVELDAESWDRLLTWIDLNAPYHGTWGEIVGEEKVARVAARRRLMSRRYAGIDVDPEERPRGGRGRIEPNAPAPPEDRAAEGASASGWPFSAEEARRRQRAACSAPEQAFELGDGVALELVYIPAGEYVMGDPEGCADDRPLAAVRVAEPFWMGKHEVTNEQFARFDPGHDSGVEPMHGYQFGIRGYPVNRPRQPVVRVSWEEAMAFCEWLTQRTGRAFTLPTEAQWEYACRAGSASPLWWGGMDADFSRNGNLGDARLREFALDTYIVVRLVPNPNRYDDWVPKDDRFDDGGFVSTDVGSYLPNAWGLDDIHGNVWEWTRSLYRPYPYREDDRRNDLGADGRRAVRGGSWYDRPKRCRSAFRLSYEPYQRVFNVGFRVVMLARAEEEAGRGGAAGPR